MDNIKALEQMFINNLGNTITVELANGMIQTIRQLIPIIKEVTELPKEE
jgi:hypothetical protein